MRKVERFSVAILFLSKKDKLSNIDIYIYTYLFFIFYFSLKNSRIFSTDS